MTHLNYPDGITIAELKRLLANAPEVGSHGQPFRVWIETKDEAVSINEAMVMGSNYGGGDVVLSPQKRVVTMGDAGGQCGCWDSADGKIHLICEKHSDLFEDGNG